MATEGAQGGTQIARLEKGNKERTAMHASVMNEIIDRLNAVLALTVTPQGTGKFIFSDANAVLQLEGSGSLKTVLTDDASAYEDGADEGIVNDVEQLQFDEDHFEVFDGGNGLAVVKLRTVECLCEETEAIDGGDDSV